MKTYILSACRTPIGRFSGALTTLSAVDLGTLAVREAVRRSGLAPDQVDEVIMGNVLSAGLGQNPARQATLGSGLPPEVSAMTINKVCGSGLKAVTLISNGIQLGDIAIGVGGGMESMTNAPYLAPKARQGFRMGHGQLLDSMIHDGLWDAYADYHMGCTGEVISEKYNLGREAQDQFARRSHEKAVVAQQEGRFSEEIFAVEVPRKKGESVVVTEDEGPRRDTTMESLSRLRPVFKKDGTVTAGNASQISDGAAAAVVASAQVVEGHGLEPLARIVASATSGVEPSLVMMAPVDAIRKARERAGWSEEDVDLYEVNEAFAVQGLAICRELPLDPAKLNVNGGAVALGHPIGASGARVLTTLLYALRARGLKKGIASLCLGGGNGVAMAIEVV